MSQHQARLAWVRGDREFTGKTFSRDHEVAFDSGATLTVSAANGPSQPPGTVGERTADPEELTVAAAASCHMLFFLALAAKRGLIVDGYADEPVGIMESKDGATWLTKITLRPRVTWGGEPPDAKVVDELHHDAHRRCYIANSLRSEIVVEPG
jgi:organic hydroperoxide reductase OsmC/OhrA